MTGRSKVVFKEADNLPPKVLFGIVEDKGNFINVTNDNGILFTINKNCIVFIKGGY